MEQLPSSQHVRQQRRSVSCVRISVHAACAFLGRQSPLAAPETARQHVGELSAGTGTPIIAMFWWRDQPSAGALRPRGDVGAVTLSPGDRSCGAVALPPAGRNASLSRTRSSVRWVHSQGGPIKIGQQWCFRFSWKRVNLEGKVRSSPRFYTVITFRSS